MLHHGLYEQVINNALTGELAEIPEARKSVQSASLPPAVPDLPLLFFLYPEKF